LSRSRSFFFSGLRAHALLPCHPLALISIPYLRLRRHSPMPARSSIPQTEAALLGCHEIRELFQNEQISVSHKKSERGVKIAPRSRPVPKAREAPKARKARRGATRPDLRGLQWRLILYGASLILLRAPAREPPERATSPRKGSRAAPRGCEARTS
jgi:hypothetical protein